MDRFAASATRLARAVHERDLAPDGLVEDHIARMEAVNPTLNAVVATRFPAARVEAAEATRLWSKKRSKLPPLHGLPFTVKEFLAVEGLPSTGGQLFRAGRLSTETALVVRRLQAAGAILLGVTNAPEAGLWSETTNRVYGRTNNPWDVRRTPGGSSGGEGAIVAAGGAVFGVGTDIGGSIRIPAFCCGVFGHKPSVGLVPNHGLTPAVPGPLGRLHGTGPLTRSAADLRLILRVIAGPDPLDPLATEVWSDRAPDRADAVRVFVVDDLGPLLRLRPDVRDAVGTAARALSDRGARVEALDEPRLRRSFLYWAGALQEASDVRYADLLGGDQPTRLRRELFRYPLGRSPHIGAALALMVLERVFGVVGSRNADARRAEVDRLRSDLEARLGDDGVLLAPTWPRPAPRHRDMLRTPLDSTCTNLYNVLGFPATAVPTGFSGAGLPVGVQVVAARGRDDLCIRVAEWLESALGETSRPT